MRINATNTSEVKAISFVFLEIFIIKIYKILKNKRAKLFFANNQQYRYFNFARKGIIKIKSKP